MRRSRDLLRSLELGSQLALIEHTGRGNISFKRSGQSLEVLPRCLLLDFWVLSQLPVSGQRRCFSKELAVRQVRKPFARVVTVEMSSLCLPAGIATPGQGNLLSAPGLVPACIMLVCALSE